MNNKEFISELSRRLGYTVKDVTTVTDSLIACIIQDLQEGKNVTIQNFGTFEVKKKMERISVNPLTKQRFLVPPKLNLCFKPNLTLKEKLKSNTSDD